MEFLSNSRVHFYIFLFYTFCGFSSSFQSFCKKDFFLSIFNKCRVSQIRWYYGLSPKLASIEHPSFDNGYESQQVFSKITWHFRQFDMFYNKVTWFFSGQFDLPFSKVFYFSVLSKSHETRTHNSDILTWLVWFFFIKKIKILWLFSRSLDTFCHIYVF